MSQICPRPDLKYQHVENTEQPCWTALICASVWQSDSLCDTNQRRINKWSVRYLVVLVVCPVSRQCDLRWGALQLKWLISCVGPDLSDLYWAFLARLIFSISLHIYNVIMDFERRKKIRKLESRAKYYWKLLQFSIKIIAVWCNSFLELQATHF